MTHSRTDEQIQQIIAQVAEVNVEQVTLQAQFEDDLGLDSLSMVDISVRLEEELGILIDDEQLASCHCLEQLMLYAVSRRT